MVSGLRPYLKFIWPFPPFPDWGSSIFSLMSPHFGFVYTKTKTAISHISSTLYNALSTISVAPDLGIFDGVMSLLLIRTSCETARHLPRKAHQSEPVVTGVILGRYYCFFSAVFLSLISKILTSFKHIVIYMAANLEPLGVTRYRWPVACMNIIGWLDWVLALFHRKCYLDTGKLPIEASPVRQL